MGATRGYFILLCALNLAVEGNAFSSPPPDGSVTSSVVATHGTSVPAHPAASTGKNVITSTDTVHVTTATPHLLHMATDSGLTSTVVSAPIHPSAPSKTDVTTKPASKPRHTAKTYLLTAVKQAETHSGLEITTASPIHPSTPSRTDVITKPVSKPRHTTKTYLLTAVKQAETHPGLEITTAYELSKPKIEYKDVHNKTLEISCFSEDGPLPITYSIIQNQAVVLKSLTVFSRKPANFTIEMMPGSSAGYMCKAESKGQFRFSDPLMEINIPEEEDTTARSEGEKDGDNSGPKHLITLSLILTSVNRVVQHRNTILISVCGPVILFVLGMFIVVSHICHRRNTGDKP